MQSEVDGEQLFKWLSRLRSSADAELLLGRVIYDGKKPDEDYRVTAVSLDPVCISCGEVELTGKRLRDAYLLDPDNRVREAIEAGKSEFQKDFEAAKRSLASWGFNASKLNGDAALTLAAAISDVRRGRPLSAQLRVDVFSVLNRHRLFGLGLKMAKAAIQVALKEGRFDPFLYVQLASFARECRRLPTALTATNILFKRSPEEIGNSALKILYSQRAAILMDMFQQADDVRMLEEARRCVDQAAELGGSELQDALAGRLAMLLTAGERSGFPGMESSVLPA